MDTIEKSGKKQADVTEDYERQLIHRGIKPTAVRLLVVRALANAECALSLTDLEGRIGTVDKSSIFRTLALFLQHHLIHDVEDGTGQVKYALCAERCHCGEDVHAGLTDLHTHFYCEKCHRTFCLEKIHIPVIDLPKGFTLHSVNYVVKGVCAECSKV